MALTRWNAPERPKLRKDLECKRLQQGEGFIFKLRAPESTSECLLHDVELSVLSLMTGKRTLAEICEMSGKRGLPMNPDQLEKFLRELAAYGFIANADPLPKWGTEPTAEAPPPPAAPAASAPAAPAPPVAAPATEEVGPPPPGPMFISLSTRPPVAPQGASRWSDVRLVAVSKGASLEMVDRARDLALASWDKVKAAPPRTQRILAVAGAAVVLVGLLGLIRVPKHARFPVQLSSEGGVEVRPSCEGILGAWTVRDGQRVAKGEVLGKLDVDVLKGELDRLDGLISQGAAELAVMRKGTDPNEVDLAGRALAKQMRQLSVMKRNKRTAKSSQAAELAQKVALARKNLALLTEGGEPGAIVRKEVETDALRKTRQCSEAALKVPELRSPATGFVAQALPASRIKTAIKSNELIAQIVPSDRWTAVIEVPEPVTSHVSVGAPVEFIPERSGARLSGSVVSITPGAAAARVQVELVDPQGSAQPGSSGSVALNVGKRSLLSFAAR